MCTRRKFDVNSAKSKVMVVKREGEFDCRGAIDGLTLEVVSEFVCLGVAINKIIWILEKVKNNLVQGRKVEVK